MKVKMKVQISGTRDGSPWPAPGGVVDVEDAEGADLCAGNLAEPVASDPVEKAVAPAAEELREQPRRRGRPAKAQAEGTKAD